LGCSGRGGGTPSAGYFFLDSGFRSQPKAAASLRRNDGWGVFMLRGLRVVGVPRSRKRFTCCASWALRGKEFYFRVVWVVVFVIGKLFPDCAVFYPLFDCCDLFFCQLISTFGHFEFACPLEYGDYEAAIRVSGDDDGAVFACGLEGSE